MAAGGGSKHAGAVRAGANALPGSSALLAARVGPLPRNKGSKGGALPVDKGFTAVAPGINAFVAPRATLPGAGVVSDGSLGTGQVSYNGSGVYTIPASVGTQRGGNLFESFGAFNLAAGETAAFQGPASVQNLLARVTGGSASSLDGTIRCDIPGANLFLLNPAGLVFGPHASLSVSGAFTASTASYVKLADGGQFNTSVGTTADATLSAGAVSAFGFAGPALPAPVSFAGTALSVPAGTALSVIAGDVSLDSATGDATTPGAALSAPSGALTIWSVASAGEVSFSPANSGTATVSALGAVSLKNGSSLAIDGAGGGALVVQAGTITLDHSLISSLNSGLAPGGSITLDAAGAFSILAGPLGSINVDTVGAGRAGDLTIRAGSLDIVGVGVNTLAAIRDLSDAGATGDGGDLNIAVAKALEISGSGEIFSGTESAGHGGQTTVHAGSLKIDGAAGQGGLTGIAVQSEFQATGDAGDLAVSVRHALVLSNGSEISASTFSDGRAGDLTIRAGSLQVVGSATENAVTGIVDQAELPPAGDHPTGSAGKMEVFVRHAVDLEAGGTIIASTFTAGRGGDMTIQASSVRIDGSAAPALFTGIASDSAAGATGPAGQINILVSGAFDILKHGTITVDTFSPGRGGDLTIQAGSLNIRGLTTPGVFTGIASESEAGATGPAGQVNILVSGALNILGHSEIAASTFSPGRGGNLTIQAGSLNIDGSNAPALFTGIGSNSEAGANGNNGNAGDVNIVVRDALNISAGEIAASTTSNGHGGVLTIRAGSLNIDGSATPGYFTGITANSLRDSNNQGNGQGGSLTLMVSGALAVKVGKISTDSHTAGNAGAIAISAGSILVDGESGPGTSISSDIYGRGAGGTLTLSTGIMVVQGGSEIATDSIGSGQAGDLVIHADSLAVLGDPKYSTFISSDSLAKGNAGNVSITTQNLLVDGKGGGGRAYVSADLLLGTASQGGNVTIDAGVMAVQGGGEIDTDTYRRGDAGNLAIHAGSLSVLGDPNAPSYISSDSRSTGRAGNVAITAQNFLVDGQGYQQKNGKSSAYISAHLGLRAAGGGTVTIDAGTVVMKGGAEINTSTKGNSNAGDLVVRAGSLSLLGDPRSDTSVASDTSGGGNAGAISVSAPTLLVDGDGYETATRIEATADAGAGGAGGNVTINAGNLSLRRGGFIGASTSSRGDGGNVDVTATRLGIAGTGSGIFANSYLDQNAGSAGAVTLHSSQLDLNMGGSISTNAVAADAGDVTVQVRRDATLRNGSAITSSAGAGGGNVSLQVGGTVYLLDSTLAATAGTDRAGGGVSGADAGNGGNITVDPELIVLNRSLVSANAAIGRGGRIALDTPEYLNSASAITATGATSGTVTISSPELDLSGALAVLPSSTVSAQSQLQETCAMSLNGDFSSFLAVGRGDVERDPGEPQRGVVVSPASSRPPEPAKRAAPAR